MDTRDRIVVAVAGVLDAWTSWGTTTHERVNEDGSSEKLTDALADAVIGALDMSAASSSSATRGRYEGACARLGINAGAFEACALQEWIAGKVTREPGGDYWLWLVGLLEKK